MKGEAAGQSGEPAGGLRGLVGEMQRFNRRYERIQVRGGLK